MVVQFLTYTPVVAEVQLTAFVAVKLKDHRLKRGGVFVWTQLSSCGIEAPPAKARWCLQLLEQQLQPKLNVSWISR